MKSLSYILLWLTLAFALCGLCNADEPSFIAQGAFLGTNYSMDGGQRSLTQCRFEARVKANRWLIQFEDIDVSLGKREGSYLNQVGSDGTNLYYLKSFSKEANDRWAKTNRAIAGYTEIGRVQRGTFPKEAFPLEKLLWLGLASRSEFAQKQIPSLLALGTPFPEDVVEMPIKYEFDPQRDLVPKTLFQISPGYFRVHREKAPPKDIPLPAPYQTGYVSFAFSVLQTEQLAGLNIPTSFSVEHRQVVPKNRHEALDLLVYSGVCTITNLHAASLVNSNLLPTMSSAASIVDYRFQHPGPLAYAENTRQWIDETDPNLTNRLLFARKSSTVRGAPIQASGSPKFVLLVLALFLAMPIVFFLFRKQLMNVSPHSRDNRGN